VGCEASGEMASVNEYIAQSRTFLGEVGAELRKVYWPPRQETLAFTGVVLFVVGFVAIYLGIVDYVLSLLMGLLF
jgi:preprotein translocase subunit SecE